MKLKLILDERLILNEADDNISMDVSDAEQYETIDIPNAEQGETIGASDDAEASLWTQGGTNIDWEALYSKCVDKDDFAKFWHGAPEAPEGSDIKKGYFKAIWPDNADQVKGLSYSFIESLEKLGFTAASNKFIRLINYWIATKNANLVNPKTFLIVYDLAEAGKLSDRDFPAIGADKTAENPGGTFGAYNLIYNPNLFKESTTDIKVWINYQNKIKNWFDQNSRSNALGALSLDGGNTEFAVAGTKTCNVVPPAARGPLRGLGSFKAFVDTIVGGEDEEKDADNATVTKLTNNELINSSKDNAKAALAYFMTVIGVTAPNLLSANKIKDIVKPINNALATMQHKQLNAVNWGFVFNIPKTKYTDANIVETILRTLAEKAGIALSGTSR